MQGSYLKAYSQYVNHYQTVVQLLASKKGDTELQNLLESLKPSRTGKGIKDYLIMPVQRIPRYQMLVQVCISWPIVEFVVLVVLTGLGGHTGIIE